MKVYISVDMEGIGGIVEERQVAADSFDSVQHQEARELLTAEVNAAIEGALEGGATTVVVNENHSGRELILEQVHPMAEVMLGYAKPLETLDGLDDSFDALFLVGSASFGTNVLATLVASARFRGSHLALVDKNREIIAQVGQLAQRLNRAWDADMTITTHCHHAEALDGAKFIVNSLEVPPRERL